MVLEKEEISYKHYDDLNITKLLENKDYLKQMYSIFKENHHYNLKIYTLDFFITNYVAEKNKDFFLILRNNKVVGFNKGSIVDKYYFIDGTFIYSKFQGKGYGKKLKIRLVAYLSFKKKVENFGGFILNNKIYGINEFIASRKNTSKTREYYLKEMSATYKSKDGALKPQNKLIVKRTGKR